MVKQVLAMIVLSLPAACINPVAHHTPTMTAKWDTTAKVNTTTKVDTTAKVDTTVKQVGKK